MNKLSAMEILALANFPLDDMPDLVRSAIGKLLSNYQQDRQRQVLESIYDDATERLTREIR